MDQQANGKYRNTEPQPPKGDEDPAGLRGSGKHRARSVEQNPESYEMKGIARRQPIGERRGRSKRCSVRQRCYLDSEKIAGTGV